MKKQAALSLTLFLFLLMLSLSAFSVRAEIGLINKQLTLKDGEKDFVFSFGVSPYLERKAREKGGFYHLFKEEASKGYATLYESLYNLNPKLLSFCKSIEQKYYIPPKNAKLIIEKSYPFFRYEREDKGKELDKEALARDILLAIDGKIPCVKTKTKSVESEITKEMLLEQTALKASFTTAFFTSRENRCHNIALASSMINGCVVQPKEEFSFNRLVGKREKERGFRDSTVILKGKYTEGVGGGICQVSTTLYNCALLGGMDIKQVFGHSLLPAYVSPSRDAMVSEYSDFVFINPDDYPVFIFSEIKDKTITFYLYGKKDGARRSIEWEKIKALPFQNKDEDGNPLLSTEGYDLMYEGKDGVISQSFLITDIHGKKTKKAIRKDFYQKSDAIYAKRFSDKENKAQHSP